MNQTDVFTEKLLLQIHDVMAVKGDAPLLCFIEPGDKADFSHAAIIVDESGDLVESVARISKNNVSKYEGVNCLLVRHEDMSPEKSLGGWSEIENNIGQIYPFHRLLFIAFGKINYQKNNV